MVGSQGLPSQFEASDELLDVAPHSTATPFQAPSCSKAKSVAFYQKVPYDGGQEVEKGRVEKETTAEGKSRKHKNRQASCRRYTERRSLDSSVLL